MICSAALQTAVCIAGWCKHGYSPASFSMGATHGGNCSRAHVDQQPATLRCLLSLFSTRVTFQVVPCFVCSNTFDDSGSCRLAASG